MIIFDLDDTLYPEKKFILSGFSAVASYLESNYNINSLKTRNILKYFLKLYGRGKIFNLLLDNYGIHSNELLKKLIVIYRNHKPKITLPQNSKKILNFISKKNNLYLITDGHKIVQRNKVNALDISKYFKKIFITHQYGLINTKPSLYCFNKVRYLEKCSWCQLIYIGDNPEKDFVNLNKKGSITIRIKKGEHRNIKLSKKYEAKHQINCISDLIKLNDKIKFFKK